LLAWAAETERQVVTHLQSHLERLPSEDLRSRAIVARMCEDEAKHVVTAVRNGATELPEWIRSIMRFQAKIMTRVAAVI
jgi:3-demethoxyubiquinol 3-hydroxylase